MIKTQIVTWIISLIYKTKPMATEYPLLLLYIQQINTNTAQGYSKSFRVKGQITLDYVRPLPCFSLKATRTQCSERSDGGLKVVCFIDDPRQLSEGQ